MRSSNINEDSFIENDDDVFVKESAVNISSVKDGDILITSANGSNRLVGKHAIIFKAGQAVHGGFMLIASAYGNPYFLNASMSSSWYTNFVNMYVAGGNGAIGNLKKSDLENQVIRVPSEAEQLRIGQFFQSLDQTITLHQRELFCRNKSYDFHTKSAFPRVLHKLAYDLQGRLRQGGNTEEVPSDRAVGKEAYPRAPARKL